jgi:hypothetical protein
VYSYQWASNVDGQSNCPCFFKDPARYRPCVMSIIIYALMLKHFSGRKAMNNCGQCPYEDSDQVHPHAEAVFVLQ